MCVKVVEMKGFSITSRISGGNGINHIFARVTFSHSAVGHSGSHFMVAVYESASVH